MRFHCRPLGEMGLRTSGCCHCRWATKQTAAAQENTAEYEYENWEMGMENGKRGWARLLLFIHTKLPAAKSLMPVGLQNPLRKLIQSVPLRPEMQPLRVEPTPPPHILLLRSSISQCILWPA